MQYYICGHKKKLTKSHKLNMKNVAIDDQILQEFLNFYFQSGDGYFQAREKTRLKTNSSP